MPVRATTLLNRVLGLPKTTVRGVDFVEEATVWVRPQQRVMSCPHCGFRTRHRYDTRVVDSAWRHLELGGRVGVLKLQRRRLRCPEQSDPATPDRFALHGHHRFTYQPLFFVTTQSWRRFYRIHA
ncbi:transposase family protein [Mycobacterium decipiens]|uniref:Transposase IS204/IS1001/IS1096/IS1165 zinc-finger domain-containing protein n=1 Tax=Mycobacterium decipiens TaxID=1430326 RepID=A0A1X2LJ06_9MYCO|nr:transposase family protein [Mycobacterium decipiens]OSC34073.1 hypothetical protein B8W66_23590 [Mycobacterium decipiens]